MMPVRRGRGFGILVEVDAAARLRLNQPAPMSDIQLSPGRHCLMPAHDLRSFVLSPAGNLDVTQRRRMMVMEKAPGRSTLDS
jgi:hypothetical protein